MFMIGHLKMKYIQKNIVPSLKSIPTVTIIICAKNEEIHAEKFLPSICDQIYPEDLLKIFLVNDGSDDRTEQIFKEYAAKYKNISIINIPKDAIRNLPGKKYALSQAVQKVDTKYILLTDADCTPTSNNWVKNMVFAAESTNSDVILGFGGYEYIKNSILNMFIQFETLHTAIQYASYSILGKSYMGVGRNLLYKSDVIKNAFKDSDSLLQMSHTSSGDDDLVVNYALRHNAKITPYFQKNTQTTSTTIKNFRQYFTQKSRHTSSAKYYQFSTKCLLSLYAMTHAIYWMGLIFVLILLFTDLLSPQLFLALSICYLLTTVIKIINYQLWVKHTDYKHNGLIYIMLEPIWLIYNVILSPYIFWKNTFKWK